MPVELILYCKKKMHERETFLYSPGLLNMAIILKSQQFWCHLKLKLQRTAIQPTDEHLSRMHKRERKTEREQESRCMEFCFENVCSSQSLILTQPQRSACPTCHVCAVMFCNEQTAAQSKHDRSWFHEPVASLYTPHTHSHSVTSVSQPFPGLGPHSPFVRESRVARL